MPAYYKVEATLNSQAVSVGLPSPQSVRVTLPLVGPQGPAGPQGEQGPPGEVSGSLAWDNVTDKPTEFPPEAHAASHEQDGSDPINVNFLTSVLGNDNLGQDINAIDGILNGLGTAATSDAGDFAAAVHGHVAADITDFVAEAAAAAPVQSVNGNTGTVTVAVPAASTATPQALGTAAAGTSDDYSRGDHIHAAPALNDLSNVSAATPSDNDVLVFDTGTGNWAAEAAAALPIEYVIACSDETSDLATGTAKVTFRAPVAFLLTAVAASVNTAPTGSTLIVDINNGANSTLSTKLSIDADEKTSATAASAAVIDTDYDDIAADAEITIDIDQIGSTIAGKGLKVILKGTRA
jgi:hypothetical protein